MRQDEIVEVWQCKAGHKYESPVALVEAGCGQCAHVVGRNGMVKVQERDAEGKLGPVTKA